MKLYSLAVLLLIVDSISSYHRVCYYTNWSQSRPMGGRFTPKDIDPFLCTHVIFAYARIVGNKIVPTEWNDENTQHDVGQYEKVTSLKLANPDLKVILGVEGWDTIAGLGDWPTAVNFRSDIVQSVIAFLRQKNFDGLELKWEFPTARRVRPISKEKYTTLLQDLRNGFDQEANLTGTAPLLLTAAVSAKKTEIDNKYEVPELSRLLDIINVMTFDFHGSWESTLGHQSPLYPSSSEIGDEFYKNVDEAMNNWLYLGAASEKLTVGIPLYGRTFTVMYPNETTIGALDTGMGPAGPYTQKKGFMSYYEVCELLNGGAKPTVIHHNEHRVPYLINGTTWVAYDDPESIAEKMKWLKDMKFGGAMVWALDLDDFKGEFCKSGPYPLLHTVYDYLSLQYTSHNTHQTNKLASVLQNSIDSKLSAVNPLTEGNPSTSGNSESGQYNVEIYPGASVSARDKLLVAANSMPLSENPSGMTNLGVAQSIQNINYIDENISSGMSNFATKAEGSSSHNSGKLGLEDQIVSLLTDVVHGVPQNTNTLDNLSNSQLGKGEFKSTLSTENMSPSNAQQSNSNSVPQNSNPRDTLSNNQPGTGGFKSAVSTDTKRISISNNKQSSSNKMTGTNILSKSDAITNEVAYQHISNSNLNNSTVVRNGEMPIVLMSSNDRMTTLSNGNMANTQIYDISPSIAGAVPKTSSKSNSVSKGTSGTEKLGSRPDTSVQMGNPSVESALQTGYTTSAGKSSPNGNKKQTSGEQIPGLLLSGSEYKPSSSSTNINNKPSLQEFTTDLSSSRTAVNANSISSSKYVDANTRRLNKLFGFVKRNPNRENSITNSRTNYRSDQKVLSSRRGNDFSSNKINGRQANGKKPTRKDTRITDYFGVPYSHVCEYWTVLCFEHIKKVIIHGEHWEDLVGVWQKPKNVTVTTTPDPREVIPHPNPSDSVQSNLI